MPAAKGATGVRYAGATKYVSDAVLLQLSASGPGNVRFFPQDDLASLVGYGMGLGE